MADGTESPEQWLAQWVADRSRLREERTSFKDAVEAASREGVPLDWRAVHYLESLSEGRDGFQLTASLLGFVRAYLAGRSVGTVVDPAMTAVAPLMAVVDGIAERGVGFAPSEHVRERARYLRESALIETRHGWFVPPSLPDESELGSPDLIFSAPPAGMKQEAVTYSGDHGSVEVRDAAGLHALLTARELAADGEALFLVPDGFLSMGGPHSVRQQLGAFGLHVQSCVQVVGGVRGTGINFNLLALRKQPVDAVWVGQFSPHVDTDQLATNLRDRSTGRTPEQGRLVDWEQFSGFDRLKASEDAERLAKRTGRELVVLGDLLDGDPVWPKAGVKGFVEPQPGVVYLPTFPTADARAGAAASELKASGCVALPIDAKRATPRYVAEVLNSPVGRAARQAASSGSIIRSLRRGETLEMVLPLPDMAEQRRATALKDKIADVGSEIGLLAAEAVGSSRDIADLEHEFASILGGDPVKTWIESLPFPLASIAYRYRAEGASRDKAEHLSHLFEATAVFLCAVLLSAFDADDDLREKEKDRWTGDGLDFRRAAFGTWTTLGPRLAKSARRLLSSNDNDGEIAAQMRSAFGVPSGHFVDLVTSKEVWSVLDSAREVRNAKAHGGIDSSRLDAWRLEQLEELLAPLRELTWKAMREVRLVLPREGAFRGGINDYQRALDLTGPIETFTVRPVQSTQQLEADSLYLLEAGEETARGGLKLVPLLRLGPTPASEDAACYFYSRSGAEGGLKYVSYHYREQPELELPDTTLNDCLARFAFTL